MSTYLHGTDVLGAEVSIPKAGAVYTDKATVTAVQQKLKDRGYDPGTVDGAYGPRTAAAIKKFQAANKMPQTGAIDYGLILALGVQVPTGPAPAVVSEVESVLPGGGGAAAPSASQSYASIFKPAAQGGGSVAAAAGEGFWSKPVWEGSSVKRWQGAVGGVGVLALGFGVYKLVRR